MDLNCKLCEGQHHPLISLVLPHTDHLARGSINMFWWVKKPMTIPLFWVMSWACLNNGKEKAGPADQPASGFPSFSSWLYIAVWIFCHLFCGCSLVHKEMIRMNRKGSALGKKSPSARAGGPPLEALWSTSFFSIPDTWLSHSLCRILPMPRSSWSLDTAVKLLGLR